MSQGAQVGRWWPVVSGNGGQTTCRARKTDRLPLSIGPATGTPPAGASCHAAPGCGRAVARRCLQSGESVGRRSAAFAWSTPTQPCSTSPAPPGAAAQPFSFRSCCGHCERRSCGPRDRSGARHDAGPLGTPCHHLIHMAVRLPVPVAIDSAMLAGSSNPPHQKDLRCWAPCGPAPRSFATPGPRVCAGL